MLKGTNHTELVALAQDKQIPADRSWPREELEIILETGCKPNNQLLRPGPFDVERDEIMEFIDQHREELADQLRCDGNCYLHDDAQVMWCWLNCMQHIEKGFDV